MEGPLPRLPKFFQSVNKYGRQRRTNSFVPEVWVERFGHNLSLVEFCDVINGTVKIPKRIENIRITHRMRSLRDNVLIILFYYLVYFLCDNFQLQILSSMVSQPFNCVNWLSLCFSRQNLQSLPRLFQNRPFQNVLLTLLLQPILSINV